MPDAAPAPQDWIDQLPRRPGPTPDTEYVQSPADNLWYQVPKAAAAWQPPTPAPPTPEQPGFLEQAWDKTKAFAGEAGAQLSPALMAHENPLASMGRFALANPDNPLTHAAAAIATNLAPSMPLAPALIPTALALASRTGGVAPESAQEQAQVAAQENGPDEGIVEGMKNAGKLLWEHPGTFAGQLIQQTAENPQYLAGGDLGLTVAGARIAKAAQASEAATRAAAAMGRVAGQSGSFAAMSAATEALHEAGDGAIDPSKVKTAAEQGAVYGPAVNSILRLANGKPTMRATLEELKKGLDRAPEAAAGGPRLEGPEGSTAATQGAEAPTGGSGGGGGASSGTLPELLDRARAAGVSADDLQPIMSDRLRRNISDEQARSSVQELINAAARPPPQEETPAAETPPAAPAPAAEEQPPPKATEPVAPEASATASTTEVQAAAQAPAEAPKPDENGVVKTEVAGQPVAVNVEPTELQKASGNYLKGHVDVQGIPVTIENPKGTTRSGTGPDGKPWESTLQHDYGYVKRTIGADGEHVDTFIGSHPESPRVFVVDQHVSGKFDEHKAMLGFTTRAAAVDAYNSNYPGGWKGAKHVTPMSIEQFKDWLKNGDTTQPARGQKLAPAAPSAVVAKAKPGVEEVPPANETANLARAAAAAEPGTKAPIIETPAEPPMAQKDLAAPAEPAAGAEPASEPPAVSPGLSADTAERLADPAIREEMRRMARNSGWAEIGGRVIRKSEDFNSPDYNVIRRSKWIPHEPWFQNLQNKLGKKDRGYEPVLEDAFAGKPLKAKERRTVEEMAEVAERHVKGDHSEEDLANEADARALEARAQHFETDSAHDEYAQHLRDRIDESNAEIDAIARRESDTEPAGEVARSAADEGDQRDVGQPAARQTQGGSEAGARAAPAEARGETRDLLGDDTRAAQRLADETRRRDAARNTGQDSLETGRPDDLFSAARAQTDLTDQPKTLREANAKRQVLFRRRGQGESYSSAPDSLMGFKRNGPQKGFDEPSGYKHIEKVRVTWPNDSITDAIRGLNEAHAVERARRNWPDAVIEPLGKISEEQAHALFRRGPIAGRQTLALKGKPDVAAYLKRLEDALAGHADVQVHENPKAFGKVIDQDVPHDVAGAYTSDDGTLHFIASNLPDVATAQAIFRHEGFGHFAMERSPDFEKALAMVGRLRDLGGKRINEIWKDVKARYPEADETTLRKEVIADMAERGVKNAIVDRAITGVREVLRKVGIHVNPHEAELRQMIVQAARGLPAEARALSGADRAAAYAAESALQRDNEQAAADALGRILPESEAIDALSQAKRDGNTEAVEILKELSAPLTDNTAVLASEPAEEDALRPVESKIPQAVLYARHAPMDAATKSAMDEVIDPDGRDNLSIKDRMRLAMQAVRNVDGLTLLQKNIDDLASIEQYERVLNGGKLKVGEMSPTKMARGVRNIASVMTAVMKYGAPEWKDGAFQIVPGRKGLLDIFRPLTQNPAGNLSTHFGFYAAARRASRLITEQNADGTLREKNFDAAKIKAGLDLAKQYPVLRQVFDDYQEFNGHILDLGEKAGTIDPAARAIYDKHDYVPFYRADDTISGYRRPGSKPSGGIANQREQSGRLKGSADPLRNVIENMVMNTVHLLDGAARSHAMHAVVDLFKGVVLRKEPMAVQAVRLSNEQIVRALKAAGFTVNPNMTPQQLDEWNTFFRRVAPTGPDIVRNMVGGKAEYYRVLDPLLYDALTSWAGTPEWLKKLDAFGWMSGPKRLLTATATITPRFAISNFIRDTLATWLQSNYNVGIVRGAVKGFADALRGHKDLYEVMMAGGGGGQRYDSDPQAVRALVMHNLKGRDPTGFLATVMSPTKWWGAWKAIQQAAENASRLREYRTARKAGKSVAESAFQARDVLDFAMHGSGHVAQFVNRGSPFLNARIQGTYRMARGFRDNWRAYALRGGLLAAATLGLLAINYANPRYQELPEWEKDMYWHVFAGEHHFRIPRPFELGAIFATMPERMVRAAAHELGYKGGDTASTSAAAAGRMLLDTFAFNPMPQGVRPIVEQISNYDFFRGQRIVSDTESGMLPEDQASPYTSPTLQRFTNILPDSTPSWFKSPARLEQLIRSYTSSVGATMLDGADRLTRRGLGYGDAPSSPMFGSALESFVRSGEPHTTKYAEELRTLNTEADAVYKTVTDYANKGRMEDARRVMNDNRKLLQLRPELNALGKEMRELTAEQNKVMDSPYLDADAKKKAIDRFTKQRNDIARKIAPFEDFL